MPRSLPGLCPECGATPRIVSGRTIYPHRQDLWSKSFWACTDCGKAYVGCHPGTKRPLGTLATKELRAARSRAHAAFDPIWKSRRMRRSEAYKWLAGQLGIKPADCHISWFDVETCERVVDACRGLVGGGPYYNEAHP
jgi:hypothetical protein